MYLAAETHSTYAADVVADAGGAYVTGYLTRGILPNAPYQRRADYQLTLKGEMNLFIARHRADGSVAWVRSYGDDGRLSGSALALGPDGSLYLAGDIGPSILSRQEGRWKLADRTLTTSVPTGFVARLDSSGTVEWARFIEGSGETNDIAVDSAGRVYVVGGSGTMRDWNTSGNAFLAAFGPGGEPLWFRTVAAGVSSRAEGVTATPYGVCVVGLVSLDVGPPRAGEREYARRVQQGFAAGYGHTGEGRWRHATAASSWHRLPPDSASVKGSVILYRAGADASGACYAVGGFAGTLSFGADVLTSAVAPGTPNPAFSHTDAVVLKYDSLGRPIWARQAVGGFASDFAEAVAVGSDGRITVAGDFMGVSNFGGFPLAVSTAEAELPGRGYPVVARAMFVAALDSGGTVLSAVQTMPEEATRPTAVALAPDGTVYLTGAQDGSAVYGRLVKTGVGTNAFLARLSLSSRPSRPGPPSGPDANGRAFTDPHRDLVGRVLVNGNLAVGGSTFSDVRASRVLRGPRGRWAPR